MEDTLKMRVIGDRFEEGEEVQIQLTWLKERVEIQYLYKFFFSGSYKEDKVHH